MSVRLGKEEALELYRGGADILELGRRADHMRAELHPERIVTFVVDRNINYTNVCINQCRFCAFWRPEDHEEAYLLSDEELNRKIEETLELGGTQILMQGGLNPDLDLDYYMELLKKIKSRHEINIHGFSPPEIAWMAENAGLDIRETLRRLCSAGLDSIPGGGAEILSDRVRETLSPKKIGTGRWLEVMEAAHLEGMKTTATMMFGSVEEPEDIIEHLDALRELQDRTGGFTAFIPWAFQPGNTEYSGSMRAATAVDYLRVLSLGRLYLDNFRNVQASWVTMGLPVAETALRFGANDLGSTMIEENVVAAAGVSHRAAKDELIAAARAAGFGAAKRDTLYNILETY